MNLYKRLGDLCFDPKKKRIKEEFRKNQTYNIFAKKIWKSRFL